MNVIDRLKTADNLTPKQSVIADFLIENAARATYCTLNQLCKEIKCSEVTMLNFCKKVGYNSFLELKDEFRKYSEQKNDESKRLDTKRKPKITKSEAFFEEILRDELNFINYLFESLSEKKMHCISKAIVKARYVVIIGHFKSFELGNYLRDRFISLGLSAIVVDPSNISDFEYVLSTISNEDTVIHISFPEYHYATEEIAQYVSKKTKNYLVISDGKDSPATKYAKLYVECQTKSKVFMNTWIAPFAFAEILTKMVAVYMENEKI